MTHSNIPAHDHLAQVEYWSRQVCAAVLIEDLADCYGVHGDLVWHCLCDIADPLMLDSPEGWSLLASFVGTRLGVHSTYVPTVH